METVLFYMEYSESLKIVNEMYTALYKYRNTKAWGPFKTGDIRGRAQESARKRWAELKRISRRERTVKVSFYEDRFTCETGDVHQEFRYDEIEGIYETDTTLALVAEKKRKKDGFIALKKGSVKGHSLGDLKEFLVRKCTKAGGSVTYL